MARIAIAFAESAVADLQAIVAWYEEQLVPQVGQRLVAEVMTHIEGLADNPDMGRMVPEFGQPWLRELIHPPFRIVYKREQSKLHIVRVWRSERLLQLADES